MNQCNSCGGFCKKSGCERRDNIIPCKHFRSGLTNNTAADCPYCRIYEFESQMQGLSNEINDFQNTIERQTVEIQKLKGQQSVLIDLLRESLSVLDTIDGDNCHEVEGLDDLEFRVKAAIEGVMKLQKSM